MSKRIGPPPGYMAADRIGDVADGIDRRAHLRVEMA